MVLKNQKQINPDGKTTIWVYFFALIYNLIKNRFEKVVSFCRAKAMNVERNIERRTSDAQDVISKLRFLSKVKKGERLNVSGLSVVGTSWYDKFLRAWNTMGDSKDVGDIKEGRRKSLEFIKELYDSSLKLAKSMIGETSSYYTDLWDMLLKSMKEAQPGITNLMNYYESDRLYISEVETFMDVLNAKIHDLETERYSRTEDVGYDEGDDVGDEDLLIEK